MGLNKLRIKSLDPLLDNRQWTIATGTALLDNYPSCLLGNG